MVSHALFVFIHVHSWLNRKLHERGTHTSMIAAAGYLAYDDYYKQRPALQQAQAEVQQLRQNPAPVAVGSSHPVYVPVNPPNRPTWFQKPLEESSSTLDAARRHKQKDEDTRPQP